MPSFLLGQCYQHNQPFSTRSFYGFKNALKFFSFSFIISCHCSPVVFAPLQLLTLLSPWSFFRLSFLFSSSFFHFSFFSYIGFFFNFHTSFIPISNPLFLPSSFSLLVFPYLSFSILQQFLLNTYFLSPIFFFHSFISFFSIFLSTNSGHLVIIFIIFILFFHLLLIFIFIFIFFFLIFFNSSSFLLHFSFLRHFSILLHSSFLRHFSFLRHSSFLRHFSIFKDALIQTCLMLFHVFLELKNI